MSPNPLSVAAPAPAAPFDHIAETYDEVFTDSPIGRAQREAVWRELDRIFRPGQCILELNCGTGLDAVHLAGRGVEVLACDAAPHMVEVARRRLHTLGSELPVGLRVLTTEHIAELEGEGPFDGAFSNFGGLNCVRDLGAVAGTSGGSCARSHRSVVPAESLGGLGNPVESGTRPAAQGSAALSARRNRRSLV